MEPDAILVRPAPGVTWVAFLADRRVVELWAEPIEEQSRVGGIALARVVGKRPGLDALIVRLPDGEGFARDAPKVEEGSALVVQVVRDSVAGKRMLVRSAIELTEGAVILTPGHSGIGLSKRITAKTKRAAIKASLKQVIPEDLGALVRSQPEDLDPTELAEAARILVAKWRAIQARAGAVQAPGWLEKPPELVDLAARHAPGASVINDRDGAGFRELAVANAIEEALERTVEIPGLGRLIFDTTEAAVMVDVDLHETTGGKGLVAANCRVVELVAAQLRLRGLRGTVLIDLPRMRKEDDRKTVEAVFQAAVASDPVPTHLLGWTPGGMLETTREAARRPLHEVLCDPSHVRTAPRASARFAAWRAIDALIQTPGALPARPVLEVSVDVAAWLSGPGAGLIDEARRRLGALTVRAEASCPRDDHRILSEI